MLKLELTDREEKDIQLAMYYAKRLHHGSAGHNWMMLVNKLASTLGIELGDGDDELILDKSMTPLSSLEIVSDGFIVKRLM